MKSTKNKQLNELAAKILLFILWPFQIIDLRSFQFITLLSIFMILGALVASGLTTGLDNAIMRYFKSVQGDQRIDQIMIALTSIGDIFTLVTIAIILTAIRRTRKIGMVLLISIVTIAISSIYIKPLVGRHVPPYGFVTALHLPKKFVIEDDSVMPFAHELSYPSNHIACTTAFAFIVGFGVNRAWRRAGLLIWSLPIIVGITKLYIMQHYFTDIIGGFILGLIISIVLSNIMRLDEPFLMSRFKGKADNEATK